MKPSKQITILFFTIIVAMVLAACNYIPLNINSAEIIINTGMDLSDSKALASDVASFKLTVTADGMTAIERNFTEQEFSLDIEAGPARTFMLEALDSSGNTLFSGSSTVDLTAGETVDVVINMDYSGFYVNFETNGGTSVSTHYVAAGELLAEPDSPARYGFSLTGWYTDAALTTSWDFLADAVSSDMTLYAKWNALPVYTVTFDSNGGDAVAPQNILQGEKVIEPDVPSQSGKTFNGWYSDAGLNNPWIFSADAVTVNITLYAGWLDIPSYTVTYNSNGGSAVSEQTNILENSTTSAPEAPTKAGYAFDGWFTDDGLWTDEWIFISDTVTADIELFAKWNIETYSITYNLDGGTGNSNPSTYDVETATITLTSVTKSNYEFGGWFSDAGFTSPISEITIGSSGNVEVYAYWTPTQYAITYNLNGGSNNVGNPATYTVETQTITLEDPSRSGYTFDGWFTDAGFTLPITEIAAGSTADIELFAKWNIETYSITYNLDGGTGTTNATTYNIESSTINLLEDTTRSGWFFTGWYTDPSLTNPITVIPQGSTGDLIVYAGWTSFITATFSNAGATGHIGPTQAQLDAAYAGTALEGEVTNPSTNDGYQLWTVPVTGTYTIEARGAQGAVNYNASYSGANGAVMIGDFDLISGDQLIILVGHQGSQSATSTLSSSGGGGSFVTLVDSGSFYTIVSSSYKVTPLIIAGGGGGVGGNGSSLGVGGTTVYDGTYDSGNYGLPGTSGNGGLSGSTDNTSGGGGGGGFIGDGTVAQGNSGHPGLSFLNGGTGGQSRDGDSYGGFGGGGGNHNTSGGGGAGGGYSGGTGGQYYSSVYYGGGGGGSYNDGANQSNTSGANSGHGSVTITLH